MGPPHPRPLNASAGFARHWDLNSNSEAEGGLSPSCPHARQAAGGLSPARAEDQEQPAQSPRRPELCSDPGPVLSPSPWGRPPGLWPAGPTQRAPGTPQVPQPPASPPASALCSPGVVIAGVEPRRSRVLMGVWTQRGRGVGVLPPLCLHPGVALGGSEPARPWRSAPPPFPALLFCPGAGGLGDRPLIFYSFQGFEAGEIGPALGGGMVRWRRARQGAFLGVQP